MSFHDPSNQDARRTSRRAAHASAAPLASMTHLGSRPHWARLISLSAFALLLVPSFAARLSAQVEQEGTSRTWLADRHELENRAALAEREAADANQPASLRAQRTSDAAAIRARLRDGDFRVGDRLIISVREEPALSDTFTVRDGFLLKLPDIPAIPLKGVLRSEVEKTVAARIGEFYRDREVRVMPLVSIGVLGQVTRPGYYQLPADALLSDALMAAGGPTPIANPDKMIVRRGGRTLFDARAVQEMVATNATLEALALRSGDDVMIEERQQRNWATVAQVSGVVTSVLFSVLYLARR